MPLQEINKNVSDLMCAVENIAKELNDQIAIASQTLSVLTRIEEQTLPTEKRFSNSPSADYLRVEPGNNTTSKIWLTNTETADILNVSVRKLKTMRDDKEISFEKNKTQVLFLEEEVMRVKKSRIWPTKRGKM